MRRVMIAVVFAAVTACSSASAPVSAPTDTPARASETPMVPKTPRACDDAASSGIEDTITSQLAAFARSDFAGARKFASRGFQSSVGEEAFQAIIESQFAFLLEEPAVEFRECEQIESLAQILVDIRAADPTTLRYRLVQEPEGWRIDGATIVGADQEIAA